MTSVPFMAALLTISCLGALHFFLPMPMLLLERYAPGSGWLQVLFMGLYSAWLAGKMLEPDRARKIRPRLWSVFSLVFFAQLVLGLAGLEKMLMTGQLHLPVPALILAGPLYRGTDFFMLILFVVTVLLAGPAWCSHLCYVGVWDDQLSRQSPLIKDMPAWRGKARIAVFVAVTATALILRYLKVSAALALAVAVVFALLGIMIMLIYSRRSGVMVHCTTWCPLGLLGNWLGRLAPFRMSIGEDCSGCRQCSKVCRYDALGRQDISNRRPGLSCTLCGDCVASCHTAQINYRLLNFSAKTSRQIFVALIVALHSIFLAVARI